MLDGIILGVIQGVAEWVPVSSEGMLVLAQTYLLEGQSLREMIELALFLHLGTFFAALLYFWSDVRRIFTTLFTYKKAPEKDKQLVQMLIVITVITGFVGALLAAGLEEGSTETLAVTGHFVMGLVGVLLIVTGILYLIGKARQKGDKTHKKADVMDMSIVGVAQGFAVLPGLSRSGLTIAAFLLRGFSEEETLRLSFLLSLPVVLAGNIALNLSGFAISETALIGLLVAFIVGVGTIHALFKVAHRVNFGYFVIIFGLLSILAAFV